jgi:hypothetical protein
MMSIRGAHKSKSKGLLRGLQRHYTSSTQPDKVKKSGARCPAPIAAPRTQHSERALLFL